FFSSRRRHTRLQGDWSSDVCSSDLAHTVSSFLRVYRASALRLAWERYGDDLIREEGFACKAELLSNLAKLGARIEEVPVALDTSRRVGESKMPILRTIGAYCRMLARQRLSKAPAVAE